MSDGIRSRLLGGESRLELEERPGTLDRRRSRT
jgi:hypothetical protein